jgi:hypothetical protein
MRRAINTPYGNIKLVTLKEFIREIPIEKAYDFAGEQGMMLVNYHVVGDEDEYNPEGRTLELKRGDPYASLKEDFNNNIGRDYVDIEDFKETLQNALSRYADNGGKPTHIINFSPRIWMVGNPSDYKIYSSGEAYGLAKFRPYSSCMYEVEYGYADADVKWGSNVV